MLSTPHSSRHSPLRRMPTGAGIARGYARSQSPDPHREPRMFKSLFKQLFFVLRIAIAWGAIVFLVVALYSNVPFLREFAAPMVVFAMGTMALVVAGAFSHLHRVRLIAG